MKTLFAVTYVSNAVSIVEFASEDGKRYQAPTKDWVKVSEPKRVVLWGQIRSAGQVPWNVGSVSTANLELQGNLNEWFVVKGVYEYWTESREVAEAVAQTAKLIGGLRARNSNHGWSDNPM